MKKLVGFVVVALIGVLVGCGKSGPTSDNPCNEAFVERFNVMTKSVTTMHNQALGSIIDQAISDVKNDLKRITVDKAASSSEKTSIDNEYESFLTETADGLGCDADLKGKLVTIDRAYINNLKSKTSSTFSKFDSAMEAISAEWNSSKVENMDLIKYELYRADVLEALQDAKAKFE